MEEMPDGIAVRGPCRALIGRMHNDDKYRGIRSNLCAHQGLGVTCGRQQEDVDNTCEVEWTQTRVIRVESTAYQGYTETRTSMWTTGPTQIRVFE